MLIFYHHVNNAKDKNKKNACRQRKDNEKISTSKDTRWAKDKNSSRTISNNSLKYPGSKPEIEETINIINIIHAPNDNNKNMKEITCNVMSEKDNNNLCHAIG